MSTMVPKAFSSSVDALVVRVRAQMILGRWIWKVRGGM